MAADPLDLERLEAVARAATPGPWFTVGPPWLPSDVETYVIAGDMDPHAGEIVCDMPSPGDVQDESGDMPADFVTGRNWANAEHIAVWNPVAALALLAALRAEQARVRMLEALQEAHSWAMTPAELRQIDGTDDELSRLRAERDALQAEVRALREQVKGLEAMARELPQQYFLGAPRMPGGAFVTTERIVSTRWLDGVKELLAALSPSSDAKEPTP